jgi:hypothetical protein
MWGGVVKNYQILHGVIDGQPHTEKFIIEKRFNQNEFKMEYFNVFPLEMTQNSSQI